MHLLIIEDDLDLGLALQQALKAEGLDSLLAQLLRQELALAAPTAMARHLDLSLEAPDVLVQTLDMHAFQCILQNLLNNALRYVQDGGEVRVELKQHLGALTLSVADNGPGIADAEHAKVFERFYRGAGHDATGSGLGLAIVKQAAARLIAKVRLSTGLGGQGCTFVLDIPAR